MCFISLPEHWHCKLASVERGYQPEGKKWVKRTRRFVYSFKFVIFVIKKQNKKNGLHGWQNFHKIKKVN